MSSETQDFLSSRLQNHEAEIILSRQRQIELENATLRSTVESLQASVNSLEAGVALLKASALSIQLKEDATKPSRMKYVMSLLGVKNVLNGETLTWRTKMPRGVEAHQSIVQVHEDGVIRFNRPGTYVLRGTLNFQTTGRVELAMNNKAPELLWAIDVDTSEDPRRVNVVVPVTTQTETVFSYEGRDCLFPGGTIIDIYCSADSTE